MYLMIIPKYCDRVDSYGARELIWNCIRRVQYQRENVSVGVQCIRFRRDVGRKVKQRVGVLYSQRSTTI